MSNNVLCSTKCRWDPLEPYTWEKEPNTLFQKEQSSTADVLKQHIQILTGNKAAQTE